MARSMRIGNLLLTTDFSKAAREAYPAAAALARDFGTQIRLAHFAAPILRNLFFPLRSIERHLVYESRLEEIERQIARGEASDQVFEGLSVVAEARACDHPYEGVVELVRSREIDLVVLSSQGESGIDFVRLGSFTRHTIRLSPAPVLTIRKPPGEESSGFHPERILVPLDFSQNSRAVFPLVRLLANRYGAQVTFLHAMESLPGFVEARIKEFSDEFAEALDARPDTVEQEFEKIRESEFSDVDCRLELREGTAYDEILKHCREAKTDLIVMATVGLTAARKILLGSVAERVVRRAPCSVATVRP